MSTQRSLRAFVAAALGIARTPIELFTYVYPPRTAPPGAILTVSESTALTLKSSGASTPSEKYAAFSAARSAAL